MFLIVGGEGSSNRNASRDESVEAGDKSVEAGDESIEAGEKTPQSCYNTETYQGYLLLPLDRHRYMTQQLVQNKFKLISLLQCRSAILHDGSVISAVTLQIIR